MSFITHRPSNWTWPLGSPVRSLVLVVAMLFMSTPVTKAFGLFIPVNPRATFLRTNIDAPFDATAIDLFRYGIEPRDRIHLARVGFYKRGAEYTDSSIDLVGVFSESATLLGSSNPRRVVGAIDAGVDVETIPTYQGGLSTNIVQDFTIGPGFVDISVPFGAAYLFVSPNDSYFVDNTDPDANFGLNIHLIRYEEPSDRTLKSATHDRGFGGTPPTLVPEPQSLLVTSLGLLIIVGSTRKGIRNLF